MHNFQSFIKSTREYKELERKTVADATNLSKETIQIIEEANNDVLLQNSSSLLKNQIRRYCEYLEISEKKIVSILNKIDILYYKKSQYGRLKFFDYLNRLAILIIIVIIGILVTKHIKENVYTANTISSDDSKSSIIYTPIDYDISDTNEDQQSNSNSGSANKVAKKTAVAHPPATANMDNITIDEPNTNENQQLTSDTDTEKSAEKNEVKKTTKAHPPTTANMDNIVIDEPSTSASNIDLSN